MGELHSEIGASSAHRWINCPGSVRLYRMLKERKSSVFADIGTAAHSICEECLTKGIDPTLYQDEVITVGNTAVTVTEDIVNAVSVYVNKVRGDLETYGGTLSVERSFSLEWLHPGMFGRNDACIEPGGIFGTLRVYDYKNGRKAVFAKNNVQMMYYALGALGQHNPNVVDTIVQTIVQPNTWGKEAIDEWEITSTELYEWGMDFLRPAAAKTQEPDAPCIVGDHCSFCEASHLCPVRMKEALDKLSVVPDTVVTQQSIVLPEANALTPEKLGVLCSFFTSDRFSSWVKAITAEEQSLLSRGVEVPGRKLIEVETLGNRKWVDESEVIAAFKEYGDELFVNKIKSPAQIEKMLSADGMKKKERDEVIAGLVTRERSTKAIVVDADDKRAALSEQAQHAISLFKEN